MNGLLPEDENGIGYANKDKYDRYVAFEIQPGKSESNARKATNV